VYTLDQRADTTEYTELQPLLSGVNSVMRVKSVLAGEGGECNGRVGTGSQTAFGTSVRAKGSYI